MSTQWSLSQRQFEQIRVLVKQVSSIDIPLNKKQMMETRLYKRAIQLNLRNFKEYFFVLTKFAEKEIPFLISLCTTHTTNFFREAGHFDYLKKDILYHLMIDRELTTAPFRVWCAASSTGEEVYTLAMVIDKFYRDNGLYPDFEIYATDIDVHSVNYAKQGIYPNANIESIPLEYHSYLLKGTGRSEGFFKLDNRLSKKITWGIQNLFAPFAQAENDRFDTIFVRNVFIYFSPHEIESCVQRMSKVLKPERYLILGHSEHLSQVESDFELIRESIYSNKKATLKIRTIEEIKQQQQKEEEVIQTKDSDALKLLCIDDSKTIHSIVEKLFEDVSDIRIIGHAYDGQEGLHFLEEQDTPDVILCDINMPNMNGLVFLEEQMKIYKIPTLMLSSFSKEDGGFYFKALDLGAIDYVQKPQSSTFKEVKEDILLKLRSAKRSQQLRSDSSNAQLNVRRFSLDSSDYLNKVVLIGSSTGGPQALELLLSNLPSTFPPILISQHMPPAFVAHFATRLNKSCDIEVVEAVEGMEIVPGTAYISAGDRHLKIVRNIDKFVIGYDGSGRWDGQPTSVDCLFGSASTVCSDWKVISVILTGMGRDGVEGLKKLRMHKDSVYSIAQDEDSAVVWGMAGSAVEAGLIDKELPLQAIAAHLVSKLKTF